MCARGRLGVRERERRNIVWGQKSVASKWKQCNQNTMKKSVQREIKQTPVAESDSRDLFRNLLIIT